MNYKIKQENLYRLRYTNLLRTFISNGRMIGVVNASIIRRQENERDYYSFGK